MYEAFEQLGVPLQIRLRKRTSHHQPKPVAARVLDGEPHEFSADPAATPRIRHAGVNENECVRGSFVYEFSEVTLALRLEAMRRRIVDDGHAPGNPTSRSEAVVLWSRRGAEPTASAPARTRVRMLRMHDINTLLTG